MNSADFQKGGFSPEDSIQVAKLFSDSEIDNEISEELTSNQDC